MMSALSCGVKLRRLFGDLGMRDERAERLMRQISAAS